jgi:alpha-beta hydrolase superfamily lysophospholipase
MDLRGHGRTAESTGIGRFGAPGVDSVLDDVHALHLLIAERHPGVPGVLLGHSMGSIIALASAERDGADLAGPVLSGPLGVAPHLADMVTALEEAFAVGAGDNASTRSGPSTSRSSPPAPGTTGCRVTRQRSTPT